MTNPIQAVLGTWVTSGTSVPIQPNALGGSQPAGGPGSSILLLFNMFPGSATLSGVADNQTGSPNTYTKLTSIASIHVSAELWWCQNPVINLANYTATGTLSGSVDCLPRLIELSGITGSDSNGTASNTSIATSLLAVTCSGANTNANDFIVGLCAMNYYPSANPLLLGASGYTNMGTDQGFGVPYVDSNCSYKLVSAPETSSASWPWTYDGTNPASYVALIQTFKTTSSSAVPIAWII